MGKRGSKLLETADRQISRLIRLVAQVDETVLRLPCPGREKLGDGTVGALASHTAHSYLRIAAFLQTTKEPSPARPGSDRVARLLSARSHTPPSHADSGQNDGTHDRGYKAENVGSPWPDRTAIDWTRGAQPPGRPDRRPARHHATRRQLQILRRAQDPGTGRIQFAQAPGPPDRRHQLGRHMTDRSPATSRSPATAFVPSI
jgi:hypothetical protein